MRFLKSLIGGKPSNVQDSFTKGLDRLSRRQPAPVTGSVVFKVTEKSRAA